MLTVRQWEAITASNIEDEKQLAAWARDSLSSQTSAGRAAVTAKRVGWTHARVAHRPRVVPSKVLQFLIMVAVAATGPGTDAARTAPGSVTMRGVRVGEASNPGPGSCEGLRTLGCGRSMDEDEVSEASGPSDAQTEIYGRERARRRDREGMQVRGCAWSGGGILRGMWRAS